jgi:phosphoenolpyruvate carboxylase
VVRAFSYFSHLANIAEDQHHNRRRRSHLLAGSAAQAGSMAATLSKLDASGVSGKAVQGFFTDALISPVLTAHPTEVQRKSILDAGRELHDYWQRVICPRHPLKKIAIPNYYMQKSPSFGRPACCATQS